MQVASRWVSGWRTNTWTKYTFVAYGYNSKVLGGMGGVIFSWAAWHWSFGRDFLPLPPQHLMRLWIRCGSASSLVGRLD